MASHQPVSTEVPCLSRTMTASRVKVTMQSASHSGPNPTRLCWKPSMRCPLIGKPDGIWGKFRPPDPVDCWVCPVDVRTVTFGAARYVLATGESM